MTLARPIADEHCAAIESSMVVTGIYARNWLFPYLCFLLWCPCYSLLSRASYLECLWATLYLEHA